MAEHPNELGGRGSGVYAEFVHDDPFAALSYILSAIVGSQA
ncbi:MAG: hypothetical protein ACRDYA_15970 [Egibacteraceae bacterium]